MTLELLQKDNVKIVILGVVGLSRYMEQQDSTLTWKNAKKEKKTEKKKKGKGKKKRVGESLK